MGSKPSLSRLVYYPIKSCRGIDVERADVGPRGIDGDRRFMVVDANGHFVTQRQFPEMAAIVPERTETGYIVNAPGHEPTEIQPAYSAGTDGATLCRVQIWRQTVEATLAPPDVNVWFSSVLGFACGLVYLADDQHRPVTNPAAAFEDEVGFADGSPLLLLSASAVDQLNDRLDEPVSVDNFRPNLVVADVAPHAEDEWDAIEIDGVAFDVAWSCSRCIMTTVDPATAARRADRQPMQALREYRSRNGDVYFGQNLLPRGEGAISLGAQVRVTARV